MTVLVEELAGIDLTSDIPCDVLDAAGLSSCGKPAVTRVTSTCHDCHCIVRSFVCRECRELALGSGLDCSGCGAAQGHFTEI
jgi:hypothetical protein